MSFGTIAEMADQTWREMISNPAGSRCCLAAGGSC
jgi:hypothetical protein